MLAPNHHEQAFHIGERTALYIEHFPPLNPGRRIVGVLAGNRAGLTADAPVQIDDHPIAGKIRGAAIGAHGFRL